MWHCNKPLLIGAGLLVGFIAKFVTGSVFVFNVYQEDIKTSFNYTQKEMELLSSLLNIGLGVGFLPGIVFDSLGPRLTSLAGLFISVGGYMLLWSTTRSVTFYTTKSGLMAFYFFLCGLGSVFTYMVALNTNVVNFPDKHRGKIVGFLNACFSGSASLYSLIYYRLFVSSANESPYQSFLLFLVVLLSISGVLCLLFLRVYKKEVENVPAVAEPCVTLQIKHMHTDNTGMYTLGVEHTKKQTLFNSSLNQDAVAHPMKFHQILRNQDYLLLTTMFAISSCVGLLTQNNITVISKSTNWSEHDQVLVAVISAANGAVSICIGLISDGLKERLPRMVLIIFSCCIFTLCSILAMFSEGHFGALLSSAIFSGLATGILWTISPTVMSEMFDTSNLGRNWGTAILLAAILGMVTQYVFGYLYDARKSDVELFCYGSDCISDGLGMCVALGLLSTTLSIILTLKKRCKNICNTL